MERVLVDCCAAVQNAVHSYAHQFARRRRTAQRVLIAGGPVRKGQHRTGFKVVSIFVLGLFVHPVVVLVGA